MKETNHDTIWQLGVTPTDTEPDSRAPLFSLSYILRDMYSRFLKAQSVEFLVSYIDSCRYQSDEVVYMTFAKKKRSVVLKGYSVNFTKFHNFQVIYV